MPPVHRRREDRLTSEGEEMRKNQKNALDRWLPALLLAGVWAVPGVVRAGDPAAKNTVASESKRIVVVTSDQDGTNNQEVKVEVHVQPGKYWIGILCSPLEQDLLKQQLGIESGLVVDRVVDDSPAKQAGLQQYDVLVKVGDTPLRDLQTLVEEVDKAGGKSLAVTLLRAAKRQVVQVTPAKRPKVTATVTADDESAKEWKAMAETLHKYGVDPDQTERMLDQLKTRRFYFVMPGLVVPQGTKTIPGNLEVTISKKGNQAAHIVVKKGEKKWEVDENSVDKLPADIRPHVRKMLGNQSFNTWQEALQPRVLQQFKPEMLRPDLASPEFAKKLQEQMQQNVNRLKKQLDSVQSSPQTARSLQRIQRELQEIRQQLEKLQQGGDKPEPGKDTDS